MKFKDELKLLCALLIKTTEGFILVEKKMLSQMTAYAQFGLEALEELKQIRKNSQEEETRNKLLFIQRRYEKLLSEISVKNLSE